MGIRSDILIHWTDKEFLNEPDESAKVDKYLKRLKSIYAQGLRYSMPKSNDKVHGATGETTIPRVPMICYTELRLSDVRQHISRYGELGIGFSRDWLMFARGANPVLYVQNTGQGVVSTNLKSIIDKFADTAGLKLFLSFVKPMSDYSEPPHEEKTNLKYYDEMEWRMVIWDLYPEAVRGLPSWVNWDDSNPYFKFLPSEVAIIVAPNEATRKAILSDREMKRYFDDYLPMMVDADKCDQF